MRKKSYKCFSYIKMHINRLIVLLVFFVLFIYSISYTIAYADIDKVSIEKSAADYNVNNNSSIPNNIKISKKSINEKDKKDVIRIGFFQFNGYHMIDEYGNKSGYGYDYLQNMLSFTNWSYEYVGYDKSWNEMIEMLKNDEIDLLTSAQMNDERLEEFDFSQLAIGSSTATLYVKAGNLEYLSGDYSNYSGMRIGILNGNSRNEKLEAFAKKNNFNYKAITYNSIDEMEKDLQEGIKIDAILTSNLRVTKNEWIIAEFEPSPYYVIVKKGNIELLNEVNYAINMLNEYKPSLQNELWHKYYANYFEGGIVINADEREYLNELSNKNTVLYTITRPGRNPLSYYTNGKACGITNRVMEIVSERIGLEIKSIETSTIGDYWRIINKGDVDLVLDIPLDYNYAEKTNYSIADSYLNLSFGMVYLNDWDKKIETIATVYGAFIIDNYLKVKYPDAKLQFYESYEECIDAVKNEEADVTFTDSYMAKKLEVEDAKESISYEYVYDYSESLAMYVNDEMDNRLVSILRKALSGVSKAQIASIIYKEVSDISISLSFIEWLYRNPKAAFISILIIIIITIIVVASVARRKKIKNEKQKESDDRRLSGYIRKANEKVYEFNFEANQVTLYDNKNGNLLQITKKLDDYRELSSLVHDEDRKAIEKYLDNKYLYRLIEEGRQEYFEIRVKTKESSFQWYSVVIQGMHKDDFRPNNIMVYINNIDATRKSDEIRNKQLMEAVEMAQQANVAKSLFLSRMSHEIRTPLNAVMGYITIALDNLKEPQKVKECINKSEEAAKHLLSIINDVLDMSSIESGKLKVAMIPFNIKHVVNNVFEIFNETSKQKNITYSVNYSNVHVENVIGDPSKVKQILINLVSNAIKFVKPDGKVTIYLTQLPEGIDKVTYELSVEDNGIGMDDSFKKRIFSPFEQQDANISVNYGGTGLGLSITKNLINLMHGTISVSSKLGEGTRFDVRLEMEMDKDEKPDLLKKYDFTRFKAIVYDEDSDSAFYMKTVLEKCNVYCDVMSDAKATIKQVEEAFEKNDRYDFAVIDWKLPELMGVEITKQIKKITNDTLPIVVTTAYDSERIVAKANELGIQNVTTKPVYQTEIFNILVDIGAQIRTSKKKTKKVELSDKTVLLVEDNTMNMEIATIVLEKAGMTVIKAMNGNEAYETFIKTGSNDIDLILMDIQMPECDGYKATKLIRQSNHPNAKKIPIIAMTANVFAEDIQKVLQTGMNGHIAKPIDIKQLYDTITEQLSE